MEANEVSNRSLILNEKNNGDVMGDPIKQPALTSLILIYTRGGFLENPRQQLAFLWEKQP